MNSSVSIVTDYWHRERSSTLGMERGSEIRPTYFGHLGPPTLFFTGYWALFLYSLVSCRIYTLRIFKPTYKLIVAHVVSSSSYWQKSSLDPAQGQI